MCVCVRVNSFQLRHLSSSNRRFSFIQTSQVSLASKSKYWLDVAAFLSAIGL